MANANKRPVAALQLKKAAKIGDFVFKGKTVVQNVGNNTTYFPTPFPTLATVTTDIGKLETAQTLAQTRAAGAASARDLMYDVVLADLRNLMGYVQQRADAAANAATAIAIIQASGFELRVNGSRVKAPIVAKSIGTGQLKLVAKAAGGNRVSYNWQGSSDNGVTWHDLPITLQAKTMVSGLVPASKWLFRVRSITPSGVNDFTDPTAVIVQ
jgi:hypothetical protein